MTIALRTGNEFDLAAVGRLHYRSRAASHVDLVPPEASTFGSEEALGVWWAERFRWERDTHRLTVADDGERIVGFTYLGPAEPNPAEEPGVVELYAIHVEPSFVGTGVGRALMVDAIPHLGERPVLWVLDRNSRARRFYAQGGWFPDGVTRRAPMGAVTTHQVRYSLTRAAASGGREHATE